MSVQRHGSVTSDHDGLGNDHERKDRDQTRNGPHRRRRPTTQTVELTPLIRRVRDARELLGYGPAPSVHTYQLLESAPAHIGNEVLATRESQLPHGRFQGRESPPRCRGQLRRMPNAPGIVADRAHELCDALESALAVYDVMGQLVARGSHELLH